MMNLKYYFSLLALICFTNANQFQYGTISFLRNDTFDRQVFFKLTMGYDPEYYLRQCDETKCPGVDCGYLGCLVRPGDAIPVDLFATVVFEFGDGKTTLLYSNTPCYVVATNVKSTQIQCEFNHTYGTFRNTYIASFTSTNRRIANKHWNNPNAPYRLQAVVDFDDLTNSPIAATMPLIQVYRKDIEMFANISLGFANIHLTPLHFRFSTHEEMGGNSTYFTSLQQQPKGLQVDPYSGLLTWDLRQLSTGDGLYSFSLQISNKMSSITLDAMLNLVTYSDDRKQVKFITPTPEASSNVFAWKDEEFSLLIAATEYVPQIRYSVIPSSWKLVVVRDDFFNFTFLPRELGAFPVCFDAQNYPEPLVHFTTPYCFTVSIYDACPQHCTSPQHGKCIPSFRAIGTCKCNPGYCLSDCRSTFDDNDEVKNCEPKQFAVEFTSKIRHSMADIHVIARAPKEPLGNELWLELPHGWKASEVNSTILYVDGFECDKVACAVENNVIQLRCHNIIVPQRPFIGYTVTNVMSANNCDKMNWKLSTRICSLEDLWNQKKYFVRKCSKQMPSLMMSVLYQTKKLQCDACNACVWDHLNANGESVYSCYLHNTQFWRVGKLPSTCSLTL